MTVFRTDNAITSSGSREAHSGEKNSFRQLPRDASRYTETNSTAACECSRKSEGQGASEVPDSLESEPSSEPCRNSAFSAAQKFSTAPAENFPEFPADTSGGSTGRGISSILTGKKPEAADDTVRRDESENPASSPPPKKNTAEVSTAPVIFTSPGGQNVPPAEKSENSERSSDRERGNSSSEDHFDFNKGISPNPSPGAGRRRHFPAHAACGEGIFCGSGLRRTAFGLLAADIFLCPFALGGVPLWVVGTAALLGILSLTAAMASQAVQGHRFRISPAAAVLAAVAGTIVLQLIPLPAALLKILSPETYLALSDALSPINGARLNAAPLSMDAPATARALLTCIACLAAYLSAFQLASSDQKMMRFIAAAAALAALGIALTGCFHWLSGADRLFGFFRFSEAHPPLLTPFGNPNHLASFLSLGAVITSALAMSAETPLRRLSWWLAYAVTAIAIFLSLSRAGLAAFIVSQSLFALCCARVLSPEARESRPRSPLLLAALALSAAMTAGLFIASDKIIAEWFPLIQTGFDETKLTLAEKSAALISRFWRLGVGKDAFEPVFQNFLEAPGDGIKTFTHPENLLADWCAGFGIPLGIALLAGLAWAFWRGLRTADKSALRWGALAAVLAVALDDLFNFSLSFVGTAVPAAAVFAIGTAHRHRCVRKIPVRAAAAAVPVLLLLGTLAFSAAQNDLRKDGTLLESAARQNADRDAFFAAFRSASFRHPVDYFPRLVAAEFLLKKGDAGGALHMAGQAMRLFPALAAPHEAAARALMLLEEDGQSALEWIRAWERGSASAAAHLAELIAENRVPPLILEGFSHHSPERAAALAQRLVSRGAVDSAEIILQHIESIHGAAAFPLILKTRCAAAMKRGDKAAYLDAARRFDAAYGGKSEEGALLLSDALCAQNRFQEAAALLEARIAEQNSAALRMKLAQIFLKNDFLDEARNALKNIPLSLTRRQRMDVLFLEAAISLKAGDGIRRIQALRALSALDPRSETIGLKLAEALAANGSLQEALDETRRIIRLAEKKMGRRAMKSPAVPADPPPGMPMPPPKKSNEGNFSFWQSEQQKLLQRARALEERLLKQREEKRNDAMRRRFGLQPSSENTAAPLTP